MIELKCFKTLLTCFFSFNARIRVVPVAVSTHEIKQDGTGADPVGLMSRDLGPPLLWQLVSPLNHTRYSSSIFVFTFTYVEIFQAVDVCTMCVKVKNQRLTVFSGCLSKNCCCSVTKLCQTLATPWTAAHQASLSFTISWSLLKLMSIESMMPTNHLILCCCLLLLPSVFPSIRVFSNESDLHVGWPKYWGFIFRISPTYEYSGWISFRINWFDLLESPGNS